MVGKSVAKLGPIQKKRKVKIGALKGKLKIPKDFDGPLPAETLDEFEASSHVQEIIEKLKAAMTSLEKEKGPLLIFALFLREDSFEKWDIIISGTWLNSKEMSAYKLISSKLREVLDESELLQFSRIVLLDPEDPVVSFLLDQQTIKNGGYKELSGEALSDKFKFTIKRAYLLRSQKPQKP